MIVQSHGLTTLARQFLNIAHTVVAVFAICFKDGLFGFEASRTTVAPVPSRRSEPVSDLPPQFLHPARQVLLNAHALPIL